LIGDNLPPFDTFFQGLNFDLNQKAPFLLTMFKCGENGKNLVNAMCTTRYLELSKARKNINRRDLF